MKNVKVKMNSLVASILPDSDKKMGAIAFASLLVAVALSLCAAANSPYDLMKQRLVKDVDKVLKNTNGFQISGKKTFIGDRRGKVDGSFNDGSFGGGSGGIGESLRNLMGGSAGALSTKAIGNLRTPSPKDIDLGSGSASRSVTDIMKVVRRRTPGLRYIYNKYLKKKSGFAGKVTLRFTIAPSGEIIENSVVSSTTSFGEFDSEVKKAVSGWTFDKIKSGNTTLLFPLPSLNNSSLRK